MISMTIVVIDAAKEQWNSLQLIYQNKKVDTKKMASKRQRPLSANFVNIGNLRENKGNVSRSGLRTPPAKAKTPLVSSRSTLSQVCLEALQ